MWTSGADNEQYEALLDQCAGTRQSIPERERHLAMQKWREVYAARYHATSGKWVRGNMEWHVLSFADFRVLRGARAEAAYQSLQDTTYLVLPEEVQYPAYRVEGGKLPNLSDLGADMLVCPADYSWTMAFTHEQEFGWGPFFCRSEWAEPK